MQGILAALASLAQPILARVLLALGMSVVTLGGVTLAVDQVISMVQSNLASAPSAALQLAGLYGVWTALGLELGAVVWCASMWALTRGTKILGLGGS